MFAKEGYSWHLDDCMKQVLSTAREIGKDFRCEIPFTMREVGRRRIDSVACTPRVACRG